MIIPLSKIKPSSTRIRSTWDNEKIDELTESIKEQGLIVPIKVRPINGEFEIIYGHRRVEAMRRAGIRETDAQLQTVEELDALLQQITENEAREEVPYEEKAEGYELVLKETGWSVTKMAQYIGVPQATIGQAIAWLKEKRAGTAVIVDKELGPKDSGVIRTLEIARVFGDDVKSKKAVAQKVGQEGLSRKQARQVAEAVAAARTQEMKQHLLETPFSTMLHDPELVKTRPERPFTKPSKIDWKLYPETVAILDHIQRFEKRIPEFEIADEIGKLSSEAGRFLAVRVRRLANILLTWAQELEERHEVKG